MDLRESTVAEMIQRGDRSKWLSCSNHNIKCFTEGEIKRITSNYETIIGKGGFGEVYKGVLQDGRTVAVKRFMSNIEENFAKELKVHCEINHKNVVRLIGYCAKENALMIVSEYISKGNLSNVLHHERIPITLDIRLRIAVECSEALCYMHSQMYTQVIHGDIKPANILLDDNFNAKISDFGISRLVNTDSTLFTDHVMGSIGYMDPLFARSGRLTSKSDVYSFGIVLVELITKKKATIRNGEAGIVECFTQSLVTEKRKVRELFDVEISSQNNMKVLEGVAKLAGQCLRMEIDRRPEMRDVAERLRALRKTQIQVKQTPTIFPWGWRNKPAAQNNWQSSSSVTQQSLPYNLCRHFSLREVKSATRNFEKSHLIGVGLFGKVYYGVIDGGATKVAIKRGRFEQDVSMFQTEIAMMANLRHHHLVSLVGYCKEKNQRMLIYDYMARGTLSENLYANKMKEPPLTWRQRLDVCIGAARALHYLHECSIIPNDVSTTKILLDERLAGKFSSEVSPWRDAMDVTPTLRMGRLGCVDPEFYCTGQLTQKSNVYSFGVVLFEVLCARAAYNPNLPERQANLVYCALSCQKKGILDLIVDPDLEGKIAPWCFKKFVEIAEKCVSDRGIDRPTMQEVLENLELCLVEQSGSLGDEMLAEDDTNGPSRTERRLNLDMYLAEDDDSSHCSLVSTFEYDDMECASDGGVDSDSELLMPR
ncbi:Receptor-like protein kinase FERONIA [Triticum urartu]|uniref:Receptor-like protein kinase FERONIA n=2 Tax=Triticum urartu TaxID=4572 RepID=M7ZAR9_TRIUA|nr:receptor-like protein kinase FERONIA [Triticum urartu]XP_048532248.1 receptor-like protein kinase FERONIA [Triticum urartu]EMS49500.1 Receptor-like protein kinase FERONIA [Triticum urartu]